MRHVPGSLTLVLCGVVFSIAPAAHAFGYSDWTAKPAWPEPISFAAGGAATLTALALRHPLVENFEAYENARRPLGRWSRLGDLAGQDVPNALYVGAMLGGAILAEPWGGSALALGRAEFMVTATLEAALIVEGLKLVVREERPDSAQRTSFPSGHSATAFAFAAVVGQEHGWRWGIPAYALAAFVGWSRINDHRHFLHDTLAGATVGLSTALGIDRNRRWTKAPDQARVSIAPLLLEGGAGVVVRVAR